MRIVSGGKEGAEAVFKLRFQKLTIFIYEGTD